jgi:molybdopterin synthase sulfur carrier subunit
LASAAAISYALPQQENPVAKVVLASALARWLPQTVAADASEVALEIPGGSIGEVLERLFERFPGLRGYVVDERGAVRRHVAIFVDGDAIHHSSNLQQALGEHAEVYVMQALSGG